MPHPTAVRPPGSAGSPAQTQAPAHTQVPELTQPDEHGLHWHWLGFGQLSVPQLYALLRLRSAVFVVEQRCIFQDMDMLDPQAMHLLALRPRTSDACANPALKAPATNSQPTPPERADIDGADLVAYARCFAPGLVCAQASLGRVLTAPHARGSGLGHALVGRAVAQMQAHWGAQPIHIGAQEHLQPMYARHGFVHTGHRYIEDGIAHIGMLRPATPLFTR